MTQNTTACSFHKEGQYKHYGEFRRPGESESVSLTDSEQPIARRRKLLNIALPELFPKVYEKVFGGNWRVKKRKEHCSRTDQEPVEQKRATVLLVQ